MTKEDLSPNGTHDSDPKFQSSEQIEEQPVARAGFARKAKRHCARFWWLHLIIFCTVFLIIALCLVYAGMPRIAQKGVDDSYLEFTELKFLDPTPNSILLTQKGIIHSPSMYTPTLDPFNASLYVMTNGTYGKDRILQITLPTIHALHPQSNISLESQTVMIDSQDQLTDFATQVLTNFEVETALKGRTKLHLGKLPTVNINYNSASKYKGLNGLKGFNTTGLKINFTATPGNPNLSGFAFIPNPSVMTIAMGNVTLILSTEKHGVVGNATVNDMTLVPGNNSLPLTGIIDQPLVIDSMANGLVVMHILGRDSVYNGQHLVYYEKALQSNNLTLTMNIAQILADSAKA